VLSHDSDNGYAISSTQCRKKEQAIGRSKGGLSSKIHARTDALGTPTGFISLLGRLIT